MDLEMVLLLSPVFLCYRQHERDGKIRDALSLYNSVMGIDPNNREAADSIIYLTPGSFPEAIPQAASDTSKRFGFSKKSKII